MYIYIGLIMTINTRNNRQEISLRKEVKKGGEERAEKIIIKKLYMQVKDGTLNFGERERYDHRAMGVA